MAAKERGATGIDVWVPTPNLAEAAAAIFNQTDVRATVQQNGMLRLHIEWDSETAQF